MIASAFKYILVDATNDFQKDIDHYDVTVTKKDAFVIVHFTPKYRAKTAKWGSNSDTGLERYVYFDRKTLKPLYALVPQ